MLALCLSAFLISVDVAIVNVALPTLIRSLGATTTQLQWVIDAAYTERAERARAIGLWGATTGVGIFLPARPGREPQAQPPSPSGDPSLQAHAAEPAP